MFYSKVVNLPTLNTPYLIRTLLLALDANAPLTFPSAKVIAVSSNTGVVALGGATMAAVTDGEELDAEESTSQGGEIGIALDTSSAYLIGSANNQKALIQGTTY